MMWLDKNNLISMEGASGTIRLPQAEVAPPLDIVALRNAADEVVNIEMTTGQMKSLLEAELKGLDVSALRGGVTSKAENALDVQQSLPSDLGWEELAA